MVSPIFIFSLPRSGSTLLQRILSTNENICTSPESWLLLPLFYALKKTGCAAEYSHKAAHDAIHEFVSKLPEKKITYYKAVARIMEELYSEVTDKDCKYFLDKTPRYYLIIPEIISAFPDAKFIFLFRNPISIYSSILETWCANRFLNMDRFEIDLIGGVKHLVQGQELLADRCITIKYEDLVGKPEETLSAISNYLEIDLKISQKNDGALAKLYGDSGDQVGQREYKKLSNKPQEKWKKTFNTPYRIKVAISYLNKIGPGVIAGMGYDKTALCEEIRSLTVSYSFSIKDRLSRFLSGLGRYINHEHYRRLLESKLISKSKFFTYR